MSLGVFFCLALEEHMNKQTKIGQPELNGLSDGQSNVQPQLREDVQLVTIGPVMANRMLARNTRNRPIREDVVARYARDIVAGQWKVTGSPFVIGRDGSLLDGQHRLTAIARAGIAVRGVIMRGVDPDAQKVIDTGVPRRDSDDEAIAGHSYATDRAAWKKTIDLIATGHSRKLSLSDRLAIERKFRRAIEWGAKEILQGSLRRAPIMGALVYAHAAEPKAVPEFSVLLRTGANLPAAHPALTLRDYASRLVNSRTRQNSLEISTKTLRALQAFIDSEPLTKLQHTDATLQAFRRRVGEVK